MPKPEISPDDIRLLARALRARALKEPAEWSEREKEVVVAGAKTFLALRWPAVGQAWIRREQASRMPAARNRDEALHEAAVDLDIEAAVELDRLLTRELAWSPRRPSIAKCKRLLASFKLRSHELESALSEIDKFLGPHLSAVFAAHSLPDSSAFARILRRAPRAVLAASLRDAKEFRRKPKRKPGFTGRTCAALVEWWRKYFELRIALSLADTGENTGLFVVFVRECAAAWGVRVPSGAAIAKAVTESRDDEAKRRCEEEWFFRALQEERWWPEKEG